MTAKLTNSALCLFVLGCVLTLLGCQTNRELANFPSGPIAPPTSGPSYIMPSEPDVCVDDQPSMVDSISPDAMIDYQNVQYRGIGLSECIMMALRDSEVFRDIGGTLIAQPASMETTFDPALRYTNPTFGEDAALSAFDANIVSGLFFENNDRPFNNTFSGDADGVLVQDLGQYNLEISKLAATGTLFTSRSRINYDANNQAGNRFGSSWEAIIDTGFRHPLMQGSGSLFNRIAGPSQIPGSYNGVLIARTNTEISLADFQESVREFVSNVENAYWDLYYAYRELNAQTDARDAAYAVFKRSEAQADSERISRMERASAEEQYLRFESAIIESLEGRPVEGTQANSGSSGGSFRRTAGVRTAERRLRYLIGMPITDGVLLQPSESPEPAAMVFDWEQSVSTALSQRPETRRQRWVVKQKQLELTAAENFLLPRLDLVGNYRFRGLGKSLTGGGESLRDDINAGGASDESGAFSDLASGDFQEVQLGAELRLPVGYRRANAAVRHAQLSVQRERSILKEQERKILLDLSNSIAEARRSFNAMKLAEKRFTAAVEYRDLAWKRIDSGRSQFDVLLEAQRRILESQLQFINAEVEYSIAIKNVHFERGTFLRYHGIAMSESESNPQAYIDFETRRSGRNKEMSYVMRDASIGLKPMGSASQLPAMMTEVISAPADGEMMMFDATGVGSFDASGLPVDMGFADPSISFGPPTTSGAGLGEVWNAPPPTTTAPSANGIAPIAPANGPAANPTTLMPPLGMQRNGGASTTIGDLNTVPLSASAKLDQAISQLTGQPTGPSLAPTLAAAEDANAATSNSLGYFTNQIVRSESTSINLSDSSRREPVASGLSAIEPMFLNFNAGATVGKSEPVSMKFTGPLTSSTGDGSGSVENQANPVESAAIAATGTLANSEQAEGKNEGKSILQPLPAQSERTARVNDASIEGSSSRRYR